jgi:YD repeat-containing protein
VTTTYAYNGVGIRVSRTVAGETVHFAWDVASALPLVLDDGTYRYVYGLDLISAIDGDDAEHYFLYDGLGSVTEVTDASGAVTASYRYDVFGAVRSQSGAAVLEWRFTGEQFDGLAQPRGEAVPLDAVVSSTNLSDATVAQLEDDPDDPAGTWATATTVDDVELRVAFPTPALAPGAGAGLQEFRVLLRKDAAGGVDPTVDLELWEAGGGSALATLASAVPVSSESGQVVSVTWDAALLGTADGSVVELRIVGHASTGDPGDERAVEVGAVLWQSLSEPVTGPAFYFLRARYYDPATGRFISRDVIEFDQRYAYVDNNPMLWTDPSGMCMFGLPCPTARQVSDGLSVVGTVFGVGVAGCAVVAVATAGGASPVCGVIAGVAITANAGAFAIDAYLYRTGGDASGGQVVRSGASAALSLAGFGVARSVRPAWQLAAYAYTVPLDIINATLAGRSMASSPAAPTPKPQITWQPQPSSPKE